TIPLLQESSKIKVLTVAELFAKAITSITNDGSISKLFI
ncbi:MAG: ribose-phosphate pyrophosphokinase, partial [Roseivirga sp.]